MRNRTSVRIAASMLNADFACSQEQVTEPQRSGADRIHSDVIDGRFAPHLAISAPIVHSLRRVTQLAMEAHLMITNPDFFLEEFVADGFGSFLVRWEGNSNLHRTVERIRALGKRAGVAIIRQPRRRCSRRFCPMSTRCWS
jgi:ribulose-phosphate 3-epimerase